MSKKVYGFNGSTIFSRRMGWANKYVLVLVPKNFPEKVFLDEIFYTVFPQGISQEKNFIQINTKKVYNLVPPSRKIMIMP